MLIHLPLARNIFRMNSIKLGRHNCRSSATSASNQIDQKQTVRVRFAPSPTGKNQFKIGK